MAPSVYTNAAPLTPLRVLLVDHSAGGVQEPFTADELVSCVRGVLDDRLASESKGLA